MLTFPQAAPFDHAFRFAELGWLAHSKQLPLHNLIYSCLRQLTKPIGSLSMRQTRSNTFARTLCAPLRMTLWATNGQIFVHEHLNCGG